VEEPVPMQENTSRLRLLRIPFRSGLVDRVELLETMADQPAATQFLAAQ